LTAFLELRSQALDVLRAFPGLVVGVIQRFLETEDRFDEGAAREYLARWPAPGPARDLAGRALASWAAPG
jgi:hypothetical protein